MFMLIQKITCATEALQEMHMTKRNKTQVIIFNPVLSSDTKGPLGISRKDLYECIKGIYTRKLDMSLKVLTVTK